MGLERYITRRNTALFSAAAIFSSYFAVRNRQIELKRSNEGTFHVEPARSGGGV